MILYGMLSSIQMALPCICRHSQTPLFPSVSMCLCGGVAGFRSPLLRQCSGSSMEGSLSDFLALYLKAVSALQRRAIIAKTDHGWTLKSGIETGFSVRASNPSLG